MTLAFLRAGRGIFLAWRDGTYTHTGVKGPSRVLIVYWTKKPMYIKAEIREDAQ